MKKIALTLVLLASVSFAADAAAIYTKCAACHGADGMRKAMNKSGEIAKLTSAQIKSDLEGYKAGTLNRFGLGGVMKGQAASLSDADIAALAKYIPTLKK